MALHQSRVRGVSQRDHGTGSAPEGFEAITDVVTVEEDGEETTWGWWKTLIDPMQEGAGLVKARPDGVYLGRITYFSPME